MPIRISRSIAHLAIGVVLLSTGVLVRSLPASAADAAAAPAAGAIAWPAKVNAIYSITFNGLEFGKFVFKSDTAGAKYTIVGDAKLSAMIALSGSSTPCR